MSKNRQGSKGRFHRMISPSYKHRPIRVTNRTIQEWLKDRGISGVTNRQVMQMCLIAALILLGLIALIVYLGSQ